ncbi:MAG TPA: DUF4390 domain-containing protein [Burkholderiales bacterium]|nr:DUF4390 domain-containing protein [Burkholderiales bacterium]
MTGLRRVLLIAFFSIAVGAQAEEIQLRAAALRLANEGLVLQADFAFDFPPRLADALSNGVPLYFLVEFEMTRPRWYWADERAASKRLQLRLSYHALSRQYVLSSGPLELQFATLEEALGVLRRIRNWVVGERIALVSEAQYEAAVRMRLDVSLLPKPIQVSALTSNEWRFESAWHRFTYRSPQIQAPVESREVKPEATGQ